MRLSVRGWWQGLVAGQSTAGVRSAIALSPPATATGPYGQRDCSPLALPQPSITSVHVPSTPALAPRWLRSIRIYCEWRGKRRRALGLSSHGKQTQKRNTQAVTVRWFVATESPLIYSICHFWILRVLWQAFFGGRLILIGFDFFTKHLNLQPPQRFSASLMLSRPCHLQRWLI